MRHFFKGGWTYDTDKRPIKTSILPAKPVRRVTARVEPATPRDWTGWDRTTKPRFRSCGAGATTAQLLRIRTGHHGTRRIVRDSNGNYLLKK
jgi:hypothetical protein